MTVRQFLFDHAEYVGPACMGTALLCFVGVESFKRRRMRRRVWANLDAAFENGYGEAWNDPDFDIMGDVRDVAIDLTCFAADCEGYDPVQLQPHVVTWQDRHRGARKAVEAKDKRSARRRAWDDARAARSLSNVRLPGGVKRPAPPSKDTPSIKSAPLFRAAHPDDGPMRYGDRVRHHGSWMGHEDIRRQRDEDMSRQRDQDTTMSMFMASQIGMTSAPHDATRQNFRQGFLTAALDAAPPSSEAIHHQPCGSTSVSGSADIGSTSSDTGSTSCDSGSTSTGGGDQ